MTRKVQRPKAWDPKKLKFPVWVQPKIDGVRAYNPEGTLLARTQKKHGNRFTTDFYSKPEYIGFDGELAANDEKHPDLCRMTSSAVGSYEGEPFTLWWLFDYIAPNMWELPYSERYSMLVQRVAELQARSIALHLRIVPYVVCNTVEEVEIAHEVNMNAGYEGSCIYNPRLPHKEGDSSATHGGVNRIKDFIEFECVVNSITEGFENQNEAQMNELGRQFRTSHQDNKVLNGMLGNMECTSLADVFDLYDKKKLLIAKGQKFTCSPGNMPHADRIAFLKDPSLILGKTIKAKFFPKGIKDKPRFPTYVCIRSPEDC